jgi:HEAT repeat protein
MLAVEGLAASRDTRHHTLLEQRLGDADPGVQAQAATALGQIGARAAVPPLLKLMEETKEPRVALAAAESLAKLGEPSAIKLLEKTAKNKADPRVQLLAALALEDLSPTHAPH